MEREKAAAAAAAAASKGPNQALAAATPPSRPTPVVVGGGGSTLRRGKEKNCGHCNKEFGLLRGKVRTEFHISRFCQSLRLTSLVFFVFLLRFFSFLLSPYLTAGVCFQTKCASCGSNFCSKCIKKALLSKCVSRARADFPSLCLFQPLSRSPQGL